MTPIGVNHIIGFGRVFVATGEFLEDKIKNHLFYFMALEPVAPTGGKMQGLLQLQDSAYMALIYLGSETRINQVTFNLKD